MHNPYKTGVENKEHFVCYTEALASRLPLPSKSPFKEQFGCQKGMHYLNLVLTLFRLIKRAAAGHLFP